MHEEMEGLKKLKEWNMTSGTMPTGASTLYTHQLLSMETSWLPNSGCFPINAQQPLPLMNLSQLASTTGDAGN
ncbi:hypothetical protein E2C01_049536 [Portunus trituberculatus]|uniref:Uncharacterized protein n=1 Tax=Portunus trituberculatus TaxID=210409 RepID=A0A5B7GGB0_PORTR|nr:hypothetical protein [Portunus trituberculatus]